MKTTQVISDKSKKEGKVDTKSISLTQEEVHKINAQERKYQTTEETDNNYNAEEIDLEDEPELYDDSEMEFLEKLGEMTVDTDKPLETEKEVITEQANSTDKNKTTLDEEISIFPENTVIKDSSDGKKAQTTQSTPAGKSENMDIDSIDTESPATSEKQSIVQSGKTQRVTFSDEVNINIDSSLRRHGVNHPHKKSTDKGIVQSMIMARDRARPKFTMVAKSKESMAEQIKKRGFSMVEDEVLWETPVKVEYNIDRTITEFNVREQTLILLQKMKAIDKSIKIKSFKQNSAEWDDVQDIPEDEEFNDSFRTKDFLYRKFQKVVVHMKLVSSRHINQIKYSEQVKDFLFKNNVWLKTNRFDSKIESSPGLITMVHPKLLNRDEYTQEVVAALSEAHSNMTEKEQENLVESLGCKPSAEQKVPTFYLEMREIVPISRISYFKGKNLHNKSKF